MFINFGTILALNDSEQLTFDSYQELETIIKAYIDKASKLDEYGISDRATPIWEYGNKIIYLIGLLFIIRERILEDRSVCNVQSFEYYKEKYKLDCIRKTFSCLPIPFDVNPLYAMFGLDNYFGFDGISYMSIEEDITEACDENIVFQVNKNRI